MSKQFNLDSKLFLSESNVMAEKMAVMKTMNITNTMDNTMPVS